jgi:hypothetical protein
MGWHLFAYVDVNQKELDSLLLEHNLNKTNWDHYKTIADLYKAKHGIKLFLNYFWNSKVGMHEMRSSYGINFIRDDERLTNKRYHKLLEEKYAKPYPSCLEIISFYVTTPDEAKAVATELRTFYPDDRELIDFADWLDETSEYCSTYELSY